MAEATVGKIYIAADHAGFEYKNALVDSLTAQGYTVEDLGAHELDEQDDFPQYAFAAATKIVGGDENTRAILVCGSGEGMAIAANRVGGVWAAVCWNKEVAKESRHDNNANVLCLPARFVSLEEATDITDVWLKEPFSHTPKYERRIKEIADIYG